MLIPFYRNSSEIPEQYKDLYIESTNENEAGMFVLNVTPKEGYVLENVAPLKNALTRQKERGDKYKLQASTVPEGFDFEGNARKLKQLSEQQGFNPDDERKALKIEVQKNLEDEFRIQVEAKDSEILGYRKGIEQSAREGVYAEASKMGIDKMLLQGFLETQTRVDIDKDGYSLAYINKDGSNRHRPTDTGDVLPYGNKDFLEDLTKHEVFGKLVTTKANSGGGGDSSYTNPVQPVGKVSRTNVGDNLADLASGKKTLSE